MRDVVMHRSDVLGLPVDPLGLDEALSRVSQHLSDRQPLRVVTINAEMAMQALADPELAAIIRGAGLVIPDGSGVVWALRRRGLQVAKLAGVDFVRHLARTCAAGGHRLYLLGAAPGVAAAAAEVLQRLNPGLAVVGVRDGFWQPDEEPAVLEAIREARPDVILVALGVPRQEKWIARHQEALGVPVAMGVGGSFDVFAERVQRAPAWMRRLHLEWLFRLYQEPWRWRRMAGTLPRFAWLVLRGAKERKAA
jgi:N-acetylglucosaminyldiphosphoundecaprenol N-acetyl-beta-D-mannosaminyltransferase